MNKVICEGKVIAIFGDVSDTKDNSTDFIGSPEEMLQFAVFKCGRDKVFLSHIHKQRKRSIERTQESLIVLRGGVLALIYNEKKELIHEQEMMAGQFVICYSGGHGFLSLTDGTVFIENKLGDFIGVEEDKEKF